MQAAREVSQFPLKMQPTVSFITCLLLAVLAMIHSSEGAGGTGALSLGQACNPSASLYDDQSTRCDTSRRLSCDMKSRACKCHHEERDFYNPETDRCETKVGMFCSASETFPTICVSNAVCEPVSNFCLCQPGAEKNSDGTECLKDDDESNTGTTISQRGLSFQVAITIFAVIAGTWTL